MAEYVRPSWAGPAKPAAAATATTPVPAREWAKAVPAPIILDDRPTHDPAFLPGPPEDNAFMFANTRQPWDWPPREFDRRHGGRW